jgi:hypothetical protein
LCRDAVKMFHRLGVVYLEFHRLGVVFYMA